MTKEKFEKRLQKNLEKIRKDWLSYLDFLPDEGNKKGKLEAYLSMLITREHLSFNSTVNKMELEKENQVSMFKSGDYRWLRSR